MEHYTLEVVGQPYVFVEQIAEVCDGEGVHPVVVGRVPVAFLHHQTEPDIKATAQLLFTTQH